jgi:hypothetical protein
MYSDETVAATQKAIQQAAVALKNRSTKAYFH